MHQKEMFQTVISSQPDIHAPHSVLPHEIEKGKKMKGICGLSSEKLSQSSDRVGVFLKMLEDIFRSELTQSSMTFKPKNTPSSHVYYRLTVSAQFMKEPEFISWPTPTTGAALCGGTGNFQKMQRLKDLGHITEEERRSLTQGNGGKSNPDLMEWLMGFPIGWTELEV